MRTRPWWVVPILLYAAVRAADTLLILLAGEAYADTGRHAFEHDGSATGYSQLATLWDGQWYWSIADDGYPAELPRVDGEVQPNAWAFYPLFPLAARLLTVVLPWGFPVCAVLLTVACGAVATCLVHRIALERRGPWFAATAALVVNVFPAAPVLQLAYTEALALLWIVACLWFLHRHRHLAAVGCCLLLALTRPIALPLAVAIAWHLRGCETATSTRSRWALSLAAVATFGLWPTFVALRTHEWDAYLLTQAAWVNIAPGSSVGSWFDLLTSGPWAVVVLVVAAAALVVLTVVRPARATWGRDGRAWAASYLLFLLVATRPISSVFRFGLLLGPTLWSLDGPAEGASDGRAVRAAPRVALLVLLALVGLASQYLWLRWFYVPSRFLVSFP